ncbi:MULTISPECIES: HAMP domain-containing sensor histidine kinase [Paracoccus]|uniref:sensor histidine kinase n=1 Tax=Paracoccus TaxID=265 RepID=UPI001FB6C7C0|nr:HAMP domain-containing sensor histidine kinase [Paracoccus sp. AS002]MCJ1899524.1 HAMP domain-containing histidine kinase [Paracoccus versutus]MDF3903626.1 HAMP domain-containing sensor histidine kinase [Paracoccus sp. AS002]
MIRSIRWRLVLAGGLAIALALALSGMGLAVLFERHVERVAVADLQARALALAAMVQPEAETGARLRAPPDDPLYDQPFSGHYWQVMLGSELRRSRSLWDYTLPSDQPAPAPGETAVRTLPGPRGEPLLAVEQSLVAGRKAVPLRIILASDRDELALARRGFLGDLLPYLGLLGAMLLLASWVQITVGLRPLRQVGARVAALVSGGRPRIGQDLPTEVIPLATQIDELLDARDRELGRARHRAANLAHGLKTPLQALLGDAAELEARGEVEIARNIETVAQEMRRHVDRELARARLQSGRDAQSAEPGRIATRLIGVLRRTPLGAGIDWRLSAPPGLAARIGPDELTEALGALLENAMRHARGMVRISARRKDGRILIAILDDGPGVPEAELERLTQRGLSLDPSGEGQGIGLAVVADIVDAAQGELRLRNAHPGFLAELHLEAAPPAFQGAAPSPFPKSP